MKRILLCLFILSLSQVRASDTLTVRQVFNFNVSDTFDYVSTATVAYPYPPVAPIYSRYIIQTKTISVTGDSITYTRVCTYPSLSYDTLLFTFLDTNVIAYDTISSGPVYNLTFTIDTSWGGILYNQTACSVFEGYYGNRYQLGLGITRAERGSDGDGTIGDPAFDGITSLIYYSKAGVSAGIPYYIAILAGINNMVNTPNIKVYPNPTTDQLNLSINQMNGPNYQLIITDIWGREVYSSPVTQSESIFDISDLSQGMYTWRLLGNNSIIKTGKVIKE